MGDTEVLQLEGPRISFSQDDDMLEFTTMAEKLKRNRLAVAAGRAEELENAEEGEFSFHFSDSMSMDLQLERKMLSAEELFVDGKLRLLSKGLHQETQHFQHEGKVLQLHDNVVENHDATPRRNSDVKSQPSCCSATNVKFPANLPMVQTSLDESLSLAKQHLRSLHESPRCLSMNIEGSRSRPRRSCVSLNSSRCSSPTRLHRSSGTFSQPPTTPTSPKAASSMPKSSKFLQFFKLKKHLNTSKDALLIPPEIPTTSSAGSRLVRTFWPFSRSNSAGESKRSYSVSTLVPRRSNSAGESKTRASLLPSNAINDKKGLPPIPISIVQKNVQSNSGTNSAALAHMGDGARYSFGYSSSSTLHAFEERAQVLSAHSNEVDNSTQTNSGSSSISKEIKANSASPGRHPQHASANNSARNIAQGSYVTCRNNLSAGSSTRSMRCFEPIPRSGLYVRQKDALSRETLSVLNVPACMTPSSKSKLFKLGNLFSKREKIAKGSYTVLVAVDSQRGG